MSERYRVGGLLREDYHRLYLPFDPMARWWLPRIKPRTNLRLVGKAMYFHRLHDKPITQATKDNYDRLIATTYID